VSSELGAGHINKFLHTDPLPERGGARSNIFANIVQAPPGSTVSGGAIAWSEVRKLRNCYLATLEGMKVDCNALDVLVDIPWGKAKSDPVRFIDNHGVEKSITQVSHVSQTIFTDLTIFSAPIRVFLSPKVFEIVKNEIGAVNSASISKFFDPRGRFDDTNESV
jgi:hypothetical protein